MIHRRSPHSRVIIAILPDESSAFEAYRLLQSHGISPEHMALVGRGHTRPEHVGLVPVYRVVWWYGRRFALPGTSLGMIAGVLLQMVFQFQLWGVAPSHLLVVMAGTGAIAGLLGALVAALVAGLCYRGAEAMAYLRQGRYLLMVEGSETVTRQGRKILDQYTVRQE